jgi:uncharacterized protein (TIRG00374 family)
VSETRGSLIGRLFNWLRWPVALGILVFLGWQNREQFQQLLENEIRWHFLGLAFLVCFSAIILTFYRWYLLVWALNFPFTFRDALRLGFLGYLFNYVSPGAVGGDLVKAVLMVREQKERRMVAVATILLDRILGLLALLIVGACASQFVEQDIERLSEIATVMWGCCILGLTGLVVMLHPATPRSWWLRWLQKLPKIGGIVTDVATAISMYQSRRRIVALTIVISIFGHFGIISSFYFCARAIAPEAEVPSYVTHLLLIPPAEIVGVFVPTPGGLGALEGAVQTAYQLAGAAGGVGLLAAGAYRATTIFIAGIGGIYYAAARRQIQGLMDAERLSDSGHVESGTRNAESRVDDTPA